MRFRVPENASKVGEQGSIRYPASERSALKVCFSSHIRRPCRLVISRRLAENAVFLEKVEDRTASLNLELERQDNDVEDG